MFLYVLNISRWLRPSFHQADLPWSGSLVCTPLPPAGWSSSPSECSGLLQTHTHTEEKKTTSGHHSRSTWHTGRQRSWFSQQARAFVGDDDVSENESLWNHTAADWVTRRNVAFSSWCHPSIRCLYGADCYTSTNQKQSARAEIAPIHLQTPRSFIFNLTFKAVKLGNFRSTVYFPPLRLNCRWEEM